MPSTLSAYGASDVLSAAWVGGGGPYEASPTTVNSIYCDVSMMISSSDKATDYRKAPLEGTIVSELGGAPSAAPVGGGADHTGLADAARCEQHSGPSATLLMSVAPLEGAHAPASRATPS